MAKVRGKLIKGNKLGPLAYVKTKDSFVQSVRAVGLKPKHMSQNKTPHPKRNFGGSEKIR